MPKRAAVTTASFAVSDGAPLDLLQDAGFEVVLNRSGRKLSPEETVDLCSDCVGVLAGTETYDEDVLNRLPALRVLSRIGAGLDSIDLDAAVAHGVEIRNTPDGPTDAVVELTLAVMLAMLRHVPRMDRDLREGTWKKRMGNLLGGKRVGIVGLGRIGSRVAARLEALGCDVAYCDVKSEDIHVPFERMPLDDLLAHSDIVTLHCTSEPGCCPVIGRRELALMPQGSWLVNVSRGELLDEAALVDALTVGDLAGAAVDVYPSEPYDGPLAEMDQVVLTPHVGSYAVECRTAMELDAARNLVEALAE